MGKYIFNGVQVVRGFFVVYIFFVEMFLQNRSDQLIETALRDKLVTGLLAGERLRQIVYNGNDARTEAGKMVVDHDLVIHDIVDGLCAGVIIFHQNLQVKDNAVVNTAVILGIAAVEHAVRNENDIACMVDVRVVVQGKVKGAGQNMNNFIVRMPMVRHVVSGAVGHFMVKSDGEVEGALFPLLLVIEVFHVKWYSFLCRVCRVKNMRSAAQAYKSAAFVRNCSNCNKQVNIVAFFYIISLFFLPVSPYNR